jgi:DnaJ-domain-containing protein 1
VLPIPHTDKQQSETKIDKQDNPLVWPLLSLLKETNHSWKIHHLAKQLQTKGLMLTLDDNAEQDLFKRNFLLMNALFQLQGILLPEQWLQVHAMDIIILSRQPNDITTALPADQALREYYLDWDNYQVSGDYIRAILEQFWDRYQDHIGANTSKFNAALDKIPALIIFELSPQASNTEIRRQWRRLALRWHPDRASGNAAKFRRICEAWQVLRC